MSRTRTATFDQACPSKSENDVTWNAPLKCKTHIEKNKRWTATLAIPLKELNAYVGTGLDWRINITRCRPAALILTWNTHGPFSHPPNFISPQHLVDLPGSPSPKQMEVSPAIAKTR